MQVSLDLDLPGLEEALSELSPFGIRPLRLQLRGERLELEAQAPLLGSVQLTAEARQRPGELVLERFDLAGAGLARSLALQKLREAIAALDRRWKRIRVFGEPDGERLHLAWQ